MSQSKSLHKRQRSSSSLSDAPTDPTVPEAETEEGNRSKSVLHLPSMGSLAVPDLQPRRAHLPWKQPKVASRAPTQKNSPIKETTEATHSQEKEELTRLVVPTRTKEATPAPVDTIRPIAPKGSSPPTTVTAKPRSTAASEPIKKSEERPVMISSSPSAFDPPLSKARPIGLPPPHPGTSPRKTHLPGAFQPRGLPPPKTSTRSNKGLPRGLFKPIQPRPPGSAAGTSFTEQSTTERPVEGFSKSMPGAEAARMYTQQEAKAIITASFKRGVDAGFARREVSDAEVFAELAFCKNALREIIKAWQKNTPESMAQIIGTLRQVYREIGAADGEDTRLYGDDEGYREDQQPAGGDRMEE